MKTAEQYIRETMKPIDVDYLYLVKLSNAMKEYANQCAEHTLKDASVGALPEWLDGKIIGVDKKSILSTPIITP